MKNVVDILNKAILETLKTRGITSKEANEVVELIAEARDKALNLPVVSNNEVAVCVLPNVDKQGICFKCGNHLNEHEGINTN